MQTRKQNQNQNQDQNSFFLSPDNTY
jgi:hypothetical protein